MEPEFDLESLRWQSAAGARPVVAPSKKPPRHKPGEKFVKGPIPLRWLATAASQPGKALHVAMALWFLVGLRRNRTVALSGALLSTFGVSRYAGYRGLKVLERAGLVSVIRCQGRLPTVELLDRV